MAVLLLGVAALVRAPAVHHQPLSPWLEYLEAASPSTLEQQQQQQRPGLTSATTTTVWVDCGRGSNSGSGNSTHPLKTLAAARNLLRVSRPPGTPAVVTIRDGTCQLAEPLELTAADSHTTWRAEAAGALISGGLALNSWEPGGLADKPTVLRTTVPQLFAADGVKSLRVADNWVRPSRFPKAGGSNHSNYSAGWLYAATWSTGLVPQKVNSSHWVPEDGVMVQVGLDPACLSSDTPVWGEVLSDVRVNLFQCGGEPDVANQVGKVSGFGPGNTPTQPSLLAEFFGCGLGADSCVRSGSRLFLENVKGALSEGEFFFSHAERMLYVYPRPSWGTSFIAVVPAMDAVVKIQGSTAIDFVNLSFRDTSFFADGGTGDGDGPADDPSDAAIRINNASGVGILGCHFGSGVGGYAVAVGNASSGVRVQNCLVDGVGQGGVIL